MVAPRFASHRCVVGSPLLTWIVVVLVAAGTALAACEVREGEPEADIALAERGEEAIVEYGCLSCHAVSGLPGPQGEVGPPLDGMAERQAIAGQLPNTTENLAAWIENPQEIDPGNVMPDVGVTEEDARAIAEFLERHD